MDEPAISIIIEFVYKDRPYTIDTMFSYINGKDEMLFTDGSNMGKYVNAYGHPPKIEDKVKLISNAQGFFRLIL